MVYLSGILLAAFALVSLAAWVFVFGRILRGEPAIEFEGERSSHPHTVVAIAVFVVACFLLTAAQVAGNGTLQSSEQKTVATSDAESSTDGESDETKASAGDLVDDDEPQSEASASSDGANSAAEANLSPADRAADEDGAIEGDAVENGAATNDTAENDTAENDTTEDEAVEAALDEAVDAALPMSSDSLLLFGLIFEIAFVIGLWTLVGMTTPTPDGWGIRYDNVRSQLRVGVVAAAAAILPTLIVGSMVQHLGQEQEVIQTLRETDSVWTWVLMGLAAVVAAPLMEEMMFRVVLQGWLTSRIRAEPAIAWVAMFFAAVHGWPAMVGLMPFALIIGYVYYQTRSLISVVVMHMTFNGLMLLLLAAEVLSES